MITHEQFEELLQNGGYISKPNELKRKVLPKGIRSWWRFYIIGTLGTALSGFITALRGKFTPRTFAKMSFRLIQTVEATGTPVEIYDTDKLKSIMGKPCVFVCNHMSLVETFHLPCIVSSFCKTTIIAKSSLAKYPIFGRCLKAVKPILLDRKNPRKDLNETLSQGAERLKNGLSIILFPQGARTTVFDPKKFNSLGAKLARTAGVPIIPVACKTDYASCGKVLKDFGPIDPSKTVKYAIGPILDPNTLSQAELQEACTKFIAGKLSEWGCPCVESKTMPTER